MSKECIQSDIELADSKNVIMYFKEEDNYFWNTSIVESFENCVAQQPNNIAVIFDDKTITYGELNARANKLAHYLQEIGVGPDVLVPVSLERTIEMIVVMMAILKAGGAYVPIDPSYPIDRILFMLNDIKASMVICSQASKNKLHSLKNTVFVEVDGDKKIDVETKSNANILLKPVEHQLAYIIYTSGSTGKPKGVMIEHRNVSAFIDWCKKEFGNSHFDIVYAVTSICFDLSVFEIFYPLCIGQKVRLLENGLYIQKYLDRDINVLINTVPSVIKTILSENLDLTNVNVINMAGEPVPPSLLNDLDTSAIEVRNLYGPTEDTTYSTVYRLKKGEAILIGQPKDYTKIYIVNEQQKIAIDGEPGEIYIGGAGLARGYYNRPDLTAEKFIANLFSESHGGRLYKTGDWAKRLPGGDIEYIGRIDDQVKIRGYRIELGEIENIIAQTKLIKQTVVVSRSNLDEKSLISYYIPDWEYVAKKEHELNLQQIETWKNVYQTEYENTNNVENINPEFNISGWMSSFSEEAISEDEMHEWVDDILKVIKPNTEESILEIGCGTGLIFYQLAGKVKQYYGTDFAESSVKEIQSRVQFGSRNFGNANFWVCPAHEVELPQGGVINTILINSVCQYFPSEEYMDQIIAKCILLLKGHGRIIIGDVRDVRLLHLFKTRLEIINFDDKTTLRELNWAAQQAALDEEELCFSPDYFYNLQSRFFEISNIDIQWKSVNSINEMSLYRFNVVISVNIETEHIVPAWIEWSDKSRREIINRLTEKDPIISLINAPNPRLWKEKLISDAIENQDISNLGELREILKKTDRETEHISKILTVAQANGYQYRLLIHEDKFKTNLILYKGNSDITGSIVNPYNKKSIAPGKRFTNIPLFPIIAVMIKKEIRSFLHQRIPNYMIPQDFIALEDFPLTSNGKIDRRFLSSRNDISLTSFTKYVSAKTILEEKLVTIWQELLGRGQIGILDNFFELGGHSLVAMRLIAAVRKKLQIEMTIRDLVSYPTISGLAICLQSESKGSQLLIPLRETGRKIPLYIVCGTGGTVFKFREFVELLDADQPVYGLQQPSVEQVEMFPETVQGIAAKYIDEILKLNPDGPYSLSGHCTGGIIAFEMAQQLTAAGFTVSLLAMFDTIIEQTHVHNSIAHHLSFKLKTILRSIWNKTKFQLYLSINHPKQLWEYKIKQAGSLMGYKSQELEYMNAFNEISAIYEKAAKDYKIQNYTGDMIAFYASENYYFIDRQNNVTYKKIIYSEKIKNAWNKFVRSVTIYNVEGEHSEMFEIVNGRKLAKLLQENLNEHNKEYNNLLFYIAEL